MMGECTTATRQNRLEDSTSRQPLFVNQPDLLDIWAPQYLCLPELEQVVRRTMHTLLDTNYIRQLEGKILHPLVPRLTSAPN